MKWRLARRAFEGYHQSINGVAGAWDDLPQAERDAWLAAIVGIRDSLADQIRVDVENAGFSLREELFR